MKKEFKNIKGITLIALVVTIVVLVILGGVSVYLVLGQNGILNTTKEGTRNYKQTEANEQIALAKTDEMLNTYILSNRADTQTNIENSVELLPLTDIIAKNSYALSDSITNYKYIEIYVDITVSSATLSNSQRYPTKNLKLNNDTNGTNITIIPITVSSNSSYYCVPHFTFTSENSIYYREVFTLGWNVSKVSINVYGIK